VDLVIAHLLDAHDVDPGEIVRMVYARPLASNLVLLRARSGGVDERLREIARILLTALGRQDRATLEYLRGACTETVRGFNLTLTGPCSDGEYGSRIRRSARPLWSVHRCFSPRSRTLLRQRSA
jgi:hypothetical protein